MGKPRHLSLAKDCHKDCSCSNKCSNVTCCQVDGCIKKYPCIAGCPNREKSKVLVRADDKVLWVPQECLETPGFDFLAVTGPCEVVSITPESPTASLAIGPVPGGTGFISANLPDGTVLGGDCRGDNAVDWQMARDSADQVASGSLSVIGGGKRNLASALSATVAGGYANTASGQRSTVGGGVRNTASGTHSTVSGGVTNTASAFTSTVGGGSQNQSSSNSSVVAGGTANKAAGKYSTVGGGLFNTAGVTGTTIGGGYQNIASGLRSIVGGGYKNTASSPQSTVSGGLFNNADEFGAAIGGGRLNAASGLHSTIAGGQLNEASNSFATVGGGQQNVASKQNATVGGGFCNTASASFATVSGGYGNKASGDYSWAGGKDATASHNGSFVWGGSSTKYYSQGTNTVVMAGIYGNTTSSAKTQTVLISDDGELGTIASSLKYKENIKGLVNELPEKLETLAELRPVQFTFKSDSTGHLEYGLIAEEVAEHYPELTVYKDGEVHSVRYHLLAPLLLGELNRQKAKFEAYTEAAEARIATLEATVAKLV